MNDNDKEALTEFWNMINRIQDRIDSVLERLDSIEKRLDDLEALRPEPKGD
jgi:uncharacterized coiled-coil protein SlyX